MPNKNKPNNENNMYQLFFKGMYLFLQYDVFIFLKDIPKVLLCKMGYAKTSKNWPNESVIKMKAHVQNRTNESSIDVLIF